MSGREERSAAGRSSEAAGATLAVAAFLEAGTVGRKAAMATRSSSLAVASMAMNSLAEGIAIADISGFLAGRQNCVENGQIGMMTSATTTILLAVHPVQFFLPFD